MKLIFKASSRNGKIVKGTLEAKDIPEAAVYLRRQNLYPISITKDTGSALTKIFPFLSKTSTGDLVFFTRQVASMLTAGLTLMQSLKILKEQLEKQSMRDVLAAITADVEAGKSFSTAIGNFPDFFSPIYISLVKAAEKSGLLDKVLLRIADNLEKQQKLKSTIKGALIYPAVILVGMAGVMMIMMVVVIPQLGSLYKNLNVSLPLPTLIVLSLSQFLVFAWPLVIAGFVFLAYLYRRWYKSDTGRLIIDDMFLKIPGFGKLVKKTILTEITRTLGLLIGSGTLVVEAIRHAADTTGNVHYKKAMVDVASKVEKGVGMGDALSYSVLFPPIVIEMVRIGEQTGKLDDALMRLSEYFEREVDQAVKTITTLFEPIVIGILGIGVAFLLFAVITPIYSLLSSFQ